MLTEQQLLQILESACDRTLQPETELLESGYLDSLAMILLGEALEERGVKVSIARIPREKFCDAHTLWQWLCSDSDTA